VGFVAEPRRREPPDEPKGKSTKRQYQ
jgi:hypothetical protein